MVALLSAVPAGADAASSHSRSATELSSFRSDLRDTFGLNGGPGGRGVLDLSLCCT